MDTISASSLTRSTTDLVFDKLYNEIVNLEILPGSKMSEAEVSKRFGVSRQPIRDAFKRLGSLDLLEIRPQRATCVRLFSISEIDNMRFLRLAVELELIDLACVKITTPYADKMQKNLDAQAVAFAEGNADALHRLDYDFHKLLCEISGRPMAFETIEECKRKLDRLCMLSLTHSEGGAAVLEDHNAIFDAVRCQSVSEARAQTRHHLNRMNKIITEVHETHSNFFV